MHHSDRVKLQFGMQQGIPDPPTCLGQWHLLRIDDQWEFNDLRDFAKNQCRQWRHRRELVLRKPILQDDLKPTLQYLRWYTSVSTNLFLSQETYLIDPRQRVAT